jgi:peroxiredoxin
MEKILTTLVLTFFSLQLTNSWALDPFSKAPDFELKNQKNESVKLSQFAGKTVVLEWFNHGCPYVRKFYDAQKMQELQEQYTKKGIVWLTIVSSAVGKQGHLDSPAIATAQMEKEKSKANHMLLDTDGKVGQVYEAKTTPHLFIIDPQGALVYQGAIDSIPSADKADIPKAQNYVELALKELSDKKNVSIAKTKPYGCSIKF